MDIHFIRLDRQVLTKHSQTDSMAKTNLSLLTFMHFLKFKRFCTKFNLIVWRKCLKSKTTDLNFKKNGIVILSQKFRTICIFRLGKTLTNLEQTAFSYKYITTKHSRNSKLITLKQQMLFTSNLDFRMTLILKKVLHKYLILQIINE